MPRARVLTATSKLPRTSPISPRPCPSRRSARRRPASCAFPRWAANAAALTPRATPRGFALKFYTEDGNWDLVGNNTPVFFIRDPLKFPDFIHTQKRNPATNCKDANAFWDFLSLSPESTHQVTVLFSDRGTPFSYRTMNGYGSHTFSFVNAQNELTWVKFHFKTLTGIKNFTGPEAVEETGHNPDHATSDLFDHIAGGGTAEWDFQIQTMTQEEAATFRFDPFDVTKVWPHGEFPVRSIGKLVLNRNPKNYHAEVEQAAFQPSNLIPGVQASPDKMLQGRLFAYQDAHRYRLGVNYAQIPVNCPYLARNVNNQQRDGFMYDGKADGAPNYEPNSYDDIKEVPEAAVFHHPVSGFAGSQARAYQQDDFAQAGDLYRLQSPDAKNRLIENIVGHMGGVTRKDIQMRAICNFFRADAEYGSRIAEGLGIDIRAHLNMGVDPLNGSNTPAGVEIPADMQEKNHEVHAFAVA